MQKLSVNTGFSCPNRDGTIGRGGCIYCNNEAFVPSYCDPSDSIEVQLKKGIDFFGKKYPVMRYLAYFQAYTSTYSPNRKVLMELYGNALDIDKIEGLIISTRPDCIDKGLLKQLKELHSANKRIMFEIGVESTHNATLIAINRRHSWEQAIDAINLVNEYGFDCGVHMIMGLPGESETQMLHSVETVVKLPISTIKFHQLQIIKNTKLWNNWVRNPKIVHLFTVDEYINLCIKIIALLPKHIAVERFTASAPPHLLVAPSWGIKNYQFVHLLNQRLLQ